MAEFTVNGLDDLMLDLEQIAEIPDSVLDQMLNEQADIVVEAQRKKARAYGIQDTQKMISSIKKGKTKRLADGKEIFVYPQGTRQRGKTTTQEGEIAFINEYGKRGQPARPFIRDANAESEPAAEQAAFTVYDNFLKSKNL